MRQRRAATVIGFCGFACFAAMSRTLGATHGQAAAFGVCGDFLHASKVRFAALEDMPVTRDPKHVAGLERWRKRCAVIA